MLQVTESIVGRGWFDVPPGTPGSNAGLSNRWYSKYGLGESVAAIPFYLLGQIAMQISPGVPIRDSQGFIRADALIYTVTMLSILSSAASVALVYLVCRSLGYQQTASVVAAFGLGAGTFAWHYSRTFMSEPTSMLTNLACFYGLLRFGRERDTKWLLAAGLAAAACVLLRLTNIVLILPLGLWLLWQTLTSRTGTWGHRIARLALWTMPILVALLVIAAYNVVRFGSISETGYGGEAFAFTTPLYVGLDGLLLSPGKSVFLYAPILLIGVAGSFRLRRDHPTVALVIAAAVGIYLLYYSRWGEWYGGGAWGPRFLTAVLPLMTIGIAPAFELSRGVSGWFVLGICAALSTFVQVVSVLVPYVPYEGAMEATAASFDEMLWNPAYSPVLAEARSLILRQYPTDLAPTYYASSFLADLQLFSVVVSLGLISVGLSRFRYREPRKLDRE